jgi:hypothetical protein
LYPPKNWKGKHLPLFAPTPELLKWWKSSAQYAEAELEYERQFLLILQERQQLIDLWVRKQQQASADITLLCFEKIGDFCHRHIVGREVIGRYLPELWAGEVATANQMSTICGQNEPIPTQLSNGIAQSNTFIASDIYSEKSNIHSISESINITYPPVIQQLLSKCYDSGENVRCERLECGYYHLSLGDQDLGVWSSLGVLGVLSRLQEKFYRVRP